MANDVATIAVLAAIAAVQNRFKTRRAEKYRAEDLAQLVLQRLQHQVRLHSIDPTAAPSAYLPPAQLRDLVLPPQGSVASKKRTWERVEAIVNKNANVAMREREVGGEVWSTWEWTGPVGHVMSLGAAGEGELEEQVELEGQWQGQEEGGYSGGGGKRPPRVAF